MLTQRQIIFTLFCITPYIHSGGINLEPEQLRIGNLALPPSQQPSTLYGFGQYIVDQGDLLAACATNFISGHNNFNTSTIVPYLTYGIRDDMVVIVSLPIAAEWHVGCESSSSLSDASIEFEFVAYEYLTETSSWEVSLVGTLFLPFGNVHKKPATGFGSPSFFAGIITRYLATEWYWYVSTGGLFTTSDHHTRIGDTFLYQTGFGKNLGYESDKWTCMLLLEMNGIYTQKNKNHSIFDSNTGGNVIAVGPTLWFSTQKFIFQTGVLPVIYQSWNGHQPKLTALVNFNFEWKF